MCGVLCTVWSLAALLLIDLVRPAVFAACNLHACTAPRHPPQHQTGTARAAAPRRVLQQVSKRQGMGWNEQAQQHAQRSADHPPNV